MSCRKITKKLSKYVVPWTDAEGETSSLIVKNGSLSTGLNTIDFTACLWAYPSIDKVQHTVHPQIQWRLHQRYCTWEKQKMSILKYNEDWIRDTALIRIRWNCCHNIQSVKQVTKPITYLALWQAIQASNFGPEKCMGNIKYILNMEYFYNVKVRA